MKQKRFFYTLGLVVVMASCKTYKKSETIPVLKQTTANSKSAMTKEMASFFDAESARLKGDNKQAYTLYASFVTSYPDNATAWYQLARLQFQRREIVQAEVSAHKAFELESKNKYFAELYSEILIYQKKDKLAEQLLNTLMQQNPDNEEYLYRRAMFHVRNKEYDKSIEDLITLEKKVGFSEEIVLQRKNIFLLQKKVDLALAEVDKLRKLHPEDASYEIMMIDINREANRKDAELEGIKNLEKNYANDPVAQVELAQYYFNEHNTSRFKEFMQKVMQNKNLDPETKIALLLPMLKTLDSGTEEEKEWLAQMAKSIAQESPESKEAISLNAEVLYFLKKYDEALVEFKKVTVLDKTKFQNWNQIVAIYLDKADFDSALLYANKSLELFPNLAMPHFLKGLAYMQLKQSDKALNPFNTALELETENVELQSQLYSLLGDVYNGQKKFELSDSCFEQALKLRPNDASTLNNFAYFLSLRKVKLEQAEKMSKKSLELMPESKSFLDTYGWILYQQGKYQDAKEYITRAIKSAGNEDATLLDHMGDIYFKLGDKIKAIEYWKLAQQKGADNPFLIKKLSDEKLYE